MSRPPSAPPPAAAIGAATVRPPLVDDRDALAHCLAMMTAKSRVACAATCRTWREAANRPAAWRYWTKQLQITLRPWLESAGRPVAWRCWWRCWTKQVEITTESAVVLLRKIPAHLRPLLRRLAFSHGVLERAPAEERAWLKEYTGVEDVEVVSVGALVIFLDAQHQPSVGGNGIGRPLQRLRVRRSSHINVLWRLLTTHPRLAQLARLELPNVAPSTSQLQTIRTRLPNLEAIELHSIDRESAASFADFLANMSQLASLTLGSFDLDVQTATGPLPSSITSLTVRSLSNVDETLVNFLARAVNLRQVDLTMLRPDSIRALFSFLARLRHLDRVNLRSQPDNFRVADALQLATQNESQLEWRNLAYDETSGRLDRIDLKRRKYTQVTGIDSGSSSSSSFVIGVPAPAIASEDLRTFVLNCVVTTQLDADASSVADLDALLGGQAECLRVLHFRQLHADIWTMIGRQTRLQVLEISTEFPRPRAYSRSAAIDIDQLRQLQQLRAIKLFNTVRHLTDDVMRVLAQLPHLEQIELFDRFGPMLAGTTVDLMAHLPALRRFSFRSTWTPKLHSERLDLAFLRRVMGRVGSRLTVTYQGRVVTADEPEAKTCTVQ